MFMALPASRFTTNQIAGAFRIKFARPQKPNHPVIVVNWNGQIRFALRTKML